MIKKLFLVLLFLPLICVAHEFRDASGNFCLDLRASNVTNGEKVEMFPCDQRDSQNFIYEDRQIKYARNNEYCVDISQNEAEHGIAILWRCHGGENQQFNIVNNKIYSSVGDNQCLTMTNVNSSNANPLSAQSCNDSTEQKFTIPKVCLYQDSNYSNLIECVNESINLINKANDQLSSASIINTVAVIYSRGDYGGRRKRIDRNFPYIGDDFNDLASSIKVSAKKTYFITSDPQVWCGVKNCGVDDAESEINIKQQYQYFVTQNPNAEALIINGDLTDYGHAKEWADFERLLTSLTVDANDYMPYYYGLGNHDIYNNVNDCGSNNCTIRSFLKLYSHVNSKNNIPAFDVVHSWEYQFPEVRGSYLGSFSYSIDFGDVLFIQLNDYEEDKNPLIVDNYVSGWEGLGAQRYYINRYQDPEYSWLEQQLYQATLLGQIPVVNQHRKDGNAGHLAELLNRYNVQLKFSGHYHRNLGFDGYTGWYESGSSARGDYLRLVVDPDEKSAEIYAYDGQAGYEERLIDTVSLTQPEEIDKPTGLPAINIRVKNNGGYNSRVTVSYKNKDEVTVSRSSGTLNLGNSYLETIPATSSNISLQAFSHTGLLWEPERRIFELQDLREDTCIDIWGTTLSPQWGSVSCKE